VILPVFQQRASDDDNDRFMIKSRPADPFRSAWIGGVNILPGRDGVVRNFPAATMIGGEIQPAMAVLLSDNGALGDRSFVPDWSIDVRRIPRFSFIDILKHRVPPSALAGKRVIVGATAIELGDRYAIPRFGTVPGVVIQALAAESLIQHRALTRSGLVPTLGGILLLGLLLVGRYERSGRGFAISAGGMLAAMLVLPVAVQASWPLSIDTAPLLVAGVGAVILRLAIEARHRMRLAALSDVESGLPNEKALAAALDAANDGKINVTAASIERFESIRNALTSADVAELINKAAARVEEVVGSPVYRIAADTLAWITPAEVDPEARCAELSDRFAAPVPTARAAIDVTWTFGIAPIAQLAGSAELIAAAVAAVTDARARGLTRQWYQGIAADALRDLSMMGELRLAIDEDQLFVAYQPKLNLKSGKITMAEALVRWRHPVEGLIPPDRFLPLAEETGVVREVTRFMLSRVLADCANAAGTAEQLGVSVNVSAADIGQPEFADLVIGALERSKLDPGRLTLEITESAIIHSKETALEVLKALQAHGVRFSIDDYGTGQSTLSYLKTLPLNELKIDKMFVTHLCDNESDRIMVRSTVDLAHQLGLTVVAEGVEDWDTARLLTELGCDYAQGFVIGRGASFEQFETLAAMAFKNAA
jgi:EAL domain-containing protein (putative c-di-GMP-specific phosphodiesterase class I)/GGDEF domain-containing protein